MRVSSALSWELASLAGMSASSMWATDSYRASDSAHWTSTSGKAGLVMLRTSIRHMVVPHGGPGLLAGGQLAFPARCSSLAAVLLARLGGMLGRALLRVHSVGGLHCGGTRINNRTYQLDRYRNVQFNDRPRLCVD